MYQVANRENKCSETNVNSKSDIESVLLTKLFHRQMQHLEMRVTSDIAHILSILQQQQQQQSSVSPSQMDSDQVSDYFDQLESFSF